MAYVQDAAIRKGHGDGMNHQDGFAITARGRRAMKRFLLKPKTKMPYRDMELFRKEFLRQQANDSAVIIPNDFDIEVIEDGTWIEREIIEPQDFREIIFCDKNGIIYAGTKDELGRYIDRSGESIEGVVAWMPAPKAYEVR